LKSSEFSNKKQNESSVHSELTFKGILDVINEPLHDLVSLDCVKKRIRELGSLLLVQRLRGFLGICSTTLCHHMSFTGNPGTGKTVVAERIASILFKLGYISEGHLITVTRDDLVGQYIGHTAPKTKEVLKRAMGGVLFIDEAYYLYRPDNERDYGSEAIEILLQFMEHQRNNLVIIFAGYKSAMDKFYVSNPGLYSRVASHIHFPDYSVEALMKIVYRYLDSRQYKISVAAASYYKLFFQRYKSYLDNARGVYYLFNKSLRIKAFNIVHGHSSKVVTKRDLVLIGFFDSLVGFKKDANSL
jgi:probable Rubsico expression protein CbbX